MSNKKGSQAPSVPKRGEKQPDVEQKVEQKKCIALTFTAIDTLFFRESRPMEAQGESSSVFPAPSRTLIGAVRSLIGNQLQVDWRQFNESDPVAKVIGYSDQLGKLRFQGTWLAWNDQRLYPAPLHLMKKDDELCPLQLSEQGIRCDLGKKVRLATLPSDMAGSKPLENTWVTSEGLYAILKGELPKQSDLKKADDLFEHESRLGIARNNATRTVKKGLLYQTKHIRPKTGLSMQLDIDADLSGDEIPKSSMIRLGGEGRSAHLSVAHSAPALPDVSRIELSNVKGLLLYLLTPLLIQDPKQWQPLPSFKKKELSSLTVWCGQLHGVDLVLQGAVTGKVLRAGGWDVAKHKPRPVQSFIPAGSVFFCTLPENENANTNEQIRQAIKELNDKQIGTSTEYGYGHIAAGWWV